MKYLLFVPFLSIAFQVFGQRGIVPYYARGIDYQIHNGYIELNSGEKINGTFQYADMEFPTYNLKLFSPDGKLLKRYKSNVIKIVALVGCDTTLSTRDSTYFKTLDKSKVLYRQLTFGSIEIYDYFFNVNEQNGLIRSPILIKTNNQLIEFNSEEKFIKWMQTNNGGKIKWHKDITAADIVKQLNGIK